MVNGLGVFYANPVNNTYFTGGSYYVSQTDCSRGVSPNNSYYKLTNTSNANCYAFYDGSGSNTNSNNYSYTGKKVVYNVLYCPIDDYIPLFLFIVGGTGVFFLRKKLVYTTYI